MMHHCLMNICTTNKSFELNPPKIQSAFATSLGVFFIGELWTLSPVASLHPGSVRSEMRIANMAMRPVSAS